MALQPWEKGQWQRYTNDMTGTWPQEKVLAAPPDSDQAWTRLTPASFLGGVSRSLKGYGADLSKLPTPAAESKDSAESTADEP
jgi:hypothetical protein